MRRTFIVVMICTGLVAAVLVGWVKGAISPTGHVSDRQRRVAAQAYGRLPLGFEPNLGQTDPRVKFISRGAGFGLFLTSTSAELALPGAELDSGGMVSGRIPHSGGSEVGGALGVRLIGADPYAQVSGNEQLQGVSNYLIGNDPSAWRIGVPRYAQVTYREIYPGVSLTYYGNQGGQLEYDFTLAPGADPSLIGLAFSGASDVSLDPSGELILHLPSGDVHQPVPVIYQRYAGTEHPVSGGYVMSGTNQVGFRVGPYDPAQALVIDPTISYSTYLGGSSVDRLQYSATDGAGNVYLAGETSSLDFPTTAGSFATSLSKSSGSCENGTAKTDAFVTKLDPTGTHLVYSTYLGGGSSDCAIGIDVDPSGNAYVVGVTNAPPRGAPKFPTTSSAFQRHFGGGASDAFVTKLDPSGSSLVYSTFLGGKGADRGLFGISGAAGELYVQGETDSENFPTTAGAFQTSLAGSHDVFLAKLNAAGSGLVYSTYLGGSGFEFAFSSAGMVDSLGQVSLYGDTLSTDFPTTPGAFQTSSAGGPDFFPSDGFVTKMNATGTALVYSTYIGGSGFEDILDMTVGPSGATYVTGETGSEDFPTTAGAYQTALAGGGADGFVVELDPAGAGLVFGTYLGAKSEDAAGGVRVDSAGNVIVPGFTASKHFPVTSDAFQPHYGGGTYDAFLTKLDPTGSTLVFSSFLGGSGEDLIAGFGFFLDASGGVVLTGRTDSPDFPTTPGVFQPRPGGDQDVFVVKVSMGG